MPDNVDAKTRSEVMRRVKSANTKPEMAVRRALHAAGFRFRIHRRDLPGNPDLIFPRYRVAAFVHGCFWHWHGCKRSRMPVSNRDYWESKIARNIERDGLVKKDLQKLGWEICVIWECELQQGIIKLKDQLEMLRRQNGQSAA